MIYALTPLGDWRSFRFLLISKYAENTFYAFNFVGC